MLKDAMKEFVFRATGILVLVCALSSSAFAGQIPAPPAKSPIPGFVIGPDDVLTVTFWRDQISLEVVVRPDGRISLPLLNDVQAAGYTPEGLARALEESAAKYINEPNAVVIVKEIRSRRVFVLGEVGTPGMIPLTTNLNLLQLIAMAGGLLEHADRKNITVIRTENGQEKRLKFNYNDVVNGKNVQQNILLQPGDTVVVR
jgi:polysaccharide export outer membrane protein